MIVVITIHGIGFQQAPSSLAASDGYADALHESLRRHLEDLLGDDPTRIAAGGRGPVYAQSNYPPLTHATEPGLRRLGSWTAAGSVDITGVPLAEPGKQVAHVALVYSGLESQQSDLAALHDLAVLAKPSLDSYATLGGLGHMLVADLEALREHPAVPGAPGPSCNRAPRPCTTAGSSIACCTGRTTPSPPHLREELRVVDRRGCCAPSRMTSPPTSPATSTASGCGCFSATPSAGSSPAPTSRAR